MKKFSAMIPLIDLSSDKQIEEEIEKEVLAVLRSKWYTLGPKVESFEKSFARFVGSRYAVGVASGTDSLRLAIRALGVGRDDKVLTVSLSSPFTAIAIIEEGAIPVFCDVDEKTLTIDTADLERKIDNSTRAIIPVHLYGNPCQMDEIIKIAKKYKLLIIEDACQAHGASFGDKKIGSFGDAAAFSFYPTKNLGAAGDGGIVTTNNKKVANMVRTLRHGGQTKRFWHKFRGVNSRLDEIQAAVLSVKLTALSKNNDRRSELAAYYKKELSNLPIKFQENFDLAKSANHLFIIRTKERSALMRFLKKGGIITDIYYPYPIHKQPAFRAFSSHLLVTEKVTSEILAIPLFPTLSVKDQAYVIKSIRDFFKK